MKRLKIWAAVEVEVRSGSQKWMWMWKWNRSREGKAKRWTKVRDRKGRRDKRRKGGSKRE